MSGNSHNEEHRYEWVSSGGCTRCDALDGRFFKTPPWRPHPNCNCSILDRFAQNTDCDSSDVRYEVDYDHPNHHGPTYEPGDEFDLIFNYTIRCWGNAEVITGQVVVSMTYDQYETDAPQDFFDDAFAEALELVEEIAVEECPVCGKHPHIV
jgi:hypothetical protein